MDEALFRNILLSICSTMFCALGVWVGKNIQETRKSIETLNVHMAIVLEKISNHDIRITKLESK